MPTFTYRLSAEQTLALREASEAAKLSEQDFIELAIRSLTARYNVIYPTLPTSSVQPPASRKKNIGGRPTKAARGLHPMTRDVPAGDFVHICPVCTRSFRNDDPNGIFCSNECEISLQNRRQHLRRRKAQDG